MSDIGELPEVLFGQEFATVLVMFEEAVAATIGLNATDWRCLGIIVRGKSITAKDLSEETGLTTGAITGIIDRLEKANYVKREKNPSDRRSIIIQPLLSYKDLHSMVGHIFESFGIAVTDLFKKYDGKQIIVILDFFKQFLAIIKSETAELKKKHTKM